MPYSHLNAEANIFSPMAQIKLAALQLKMKQEGNKDVDCEAEAKIVVDVDAARNKMMMVDELKTNQVQQVTSDDDCGDTVLVQYHSSTEAETRVLTPTVKTKTKIYKHTEFKRKQFIEYCRFCKNNGEEEHFYMSHVTKAGAPVNYLILRTI